MALKVWQSAQLRSTAIGRHMHIDMFRRLDQRGVEVAMLDRVAAAAVEVAGAAVLLPRFAHRLRDPGQVGIASILPSALWASRAARRAGWSASAIFLWSSAVSWQARQSTLFWLVKRVLVRPAAAGVAARSAAR